MFESLPCQSQGNKCRNSILITCHYPDIIVVAAVFYDHWHNPKSDLGGHFNAICLKSNRKVQTAIQNANFLHWICVSQSGRKLQTGIQNGKIWHWICISKINKMWLTKNLLNNNIVESRTTRTTRTWWLALWIKHILSKPGQEWKDKTLTQVTNICYDLWYLLLKLIVKQCMLRFA